jgi:Holliday junction resolvase-like predicted endonuclease
MTNWQSAGVEVDIIARKKKVDYLVEVKFRRNSLAGDGEQAINEAKLKRLRIASLYWQGFSKNDNDIELMVITVTGQRNSIDMFRIDS